MPSSVSLNRATCRLVSALVVPQGKAFFAILPPCYAGASTREILRLRLRSAQDDGVASVVYNKDGFIFR